MAEKKSEKIKWMDLDDVEWLLDAQLYLESSSERYAQSINHAERAIDKTVAASCNPSKTVADSWPRRENSNRAQDQVHPYHFYSIKFKLFSRHLKTEHASQFLKIPLNSLKGEREVAKTLKFIDFKSSLCANFPMTGSKHSNQSNHDMLAASLFAFQISKVCLPHHASMIPDS